MAQQADKESEQDVNGADIFKTKCKSMKLGMLETCKRLCRWSGSKRCCRPIASDACSSHKQLGCLLQNDNLGKRLSITFLPEASKPRQIFADCKEACLPLCSMSLLPNNLKRAQNSAMSPDSTTQVVPETGGNVFASSRSRVTGAG